ncbi:hypothetical protein [Gordonia aichiensis]|uniref:Uncharacterized protein n=1 Tax=Gordonia aichiensis NBRC 108223 TaxID=1220583 RepID=L7KSK4_9ACTN|nr:hypothetical protein [Gordonia aichiensis]GAC50937.1 hypothetical protein GOACH_34_00200 [Gordonia aichiensis NBRC 108223]
MTPAKPTQQAEYNRTTTEANLPLLATEMRLGLREYVKDAGLELDDQSPAWVTRSSQSATPGPLAPPSSEPDTDDTDFGTLVVLTPRHLIVEVVGSSKGVVVSSVPLAQATLTPTDTLSADPAERGFTVSGFPEDGPLGTACRVGLGPEPEADDCFAAVRTAVLGAA